MSFITINHFGTLFALGYHHKGGLVNIGKSPFMSKLGKIWIEAGIYLNYPINDCSSDKQTG